MPDILLVFFMGMLPITELQGAIIFGVTVLGMDPWLAFLAGTMGCVTMAIFLLYFLESTTQFLMRHSPLMHRFFTWLFHRTRVKYSGKLSEVGHIALFSYIAIPTPGSGAWTGALIAYLFGIPRKKAAFILISGLLVTGLIVMFSAAGILWAAEEISQP